MARRQQTRQVAIVFKAIDKTSATIGRVNRLLTGFGGLVAAIGVAKLGGQFVSGMRAATTAAKDFEFAMSRVSALTRAAGADFDRLSKQSKTLGRTTVFTAVEAAEAQGKFALAGLSTKEILDAMPAALDLAAAGELAVADAASIAAEVMRTFGKEASEVRDIVNTLAGAATSSNQTVGDIGEAMKFVGPVANVLKIEVSEVAAALQLLADRGIRGSMAGTALRGVLATLLGEVQKDAKGIGELSRSMFTAEGRFKGLAEAIRIMSDAGIVAEQSFGLFGRRAGSAAAILLGVGAESIELTEDNLTAMGDVAQRVAEEKLDNLEGALTRSKSAVEGLKVAIGQRLTPVFKTFLDEGLTPAINAFTDQIENSRALERATLQTALAIARAAADTKEYASQSMALKSGVALLLGVLKTIEFTAQELNRQFEAWYKTLKAITALAPLSGRSFLDEIRGANFRTGFDVFDKTGDERAPTAAEIALERQLDLIERRAQAEERFYQNAVEAIPPLERNTVNLAAARQRARELADQLSFGSSAADTLGDNMDDVKRQILVAQKIAAAKAKNLNDAADNANDTADAAKRLREHLEKVNAQLTRMRAVGARSAEELKEAFEGVDVLLEPEGFRGAGDSYYRRRQREQERAFHEEEARREELRRRTLAGDYERGGDSLEERYDLTSIDDAEETLKRLEANRFPALQAAGAAAFSTLAQGAGELGALLVDAALGAKVSFDDFLRSLLRGLAKAIAQAFILQTVMQFGSAALSSSLGAPGTPSGSATALMQHGGIARGMAGIDRVPAMLTAGEGILTRGDTRRVLDGGAIIGSPDAFARAMGGATGSVVIENVQAMDSKSFREFLVANLDVLTNVDARRRMLGA